ncbi:high mobility group protein DSP1 isoform X2 [Eurytemora carolleeae]|nr:high mobility group protein DSP1 isoform X2 [Eurytemora carolleeae]|eukprot:XP_023326888.1 high mobility group protein DSP1-like isoform X2 [Eurytemora affinis]
MSEREKRWFNHVADTEKKKAIINSSPVAENKSRARKQKRPKDPNAPKRALSGFFWFSNEERGKVKAANPDFGVGEVAKELGKRWGECDEAFKQKYEEMAERDRARYDKEKLAYQLKQREDLIGTEDFDEDME